MAGMCHSKPTSTGAVAMNDDLGGAQADFSVLYEGSVSRPSHEDSDSSEGCFTRVRVVVIESEVSIRIEWKVLRAEVSPLFGVFVATRTQFFQARLGIVTIFSDETVIELSLEHLGGMPVFRNDLDLHRALFEEIVAALDA
jgi:hypothetical protein